MGTDETSQRLVQLRFKPLWRYVDQVREFCGAFAESTFEDDALGHRVRLTVHELIENAIKYSPQNDRASLGLSIECTDSSVEIRVTNTAQPEHAGRLRQALAALRELEPEAAYAKAMRRALTLPENESGLGLARIQHEASMSLSVEIDEAGRVQVVARGSLPAETS